MKSWFEGDTQWWLMIGLGVLTVFFSSILIMNMTISFLLGFIFNRDDI